MFLYYNFQKQNSIQVKSHDCELLEPLINGDNHGVKLCLLY